MVVRKLKLGSDGIGSRFAEIELFRVKFLIVVLSFGAALLSGCTVVLTNPPTNSQRIGANLRLLGKWTGQDEKGNRGFIKFDKGSNMEINVSIFGEKGDLGYQNPVFTMITRKIGRYNYMVLNATESSTPPGYVIARFSIAHGKLKIWTLSTQKVKEAITNGTLKGTDVGGPFGSVTVTNTSQEIATLLRSAKSDALFVSFGEFERVSGSEYH